MKSLLVLVLIFIDICTTITVVLHRYVDIVLGYVSSLSLSCSWQQRDRAQKLKSLLVLFLSLPSKHFPHCKPKKIGTYLRQNIYVRPSPLNLSAEFRPSVTTIPRQTKNKNKWQAILRKYLILTEGGLLGPDCHS